MEVQREFKYIPSHFSHLPLSIVCDIAGTWTQLNLKLDVPLVMNRGNHTNGDQEVKDFQIASTRDNVEILISRDSLKKAKRMKASRQRWENEIFKGTKNWSPNRY